MKQAELRDDELRAEISRLEGLINGGVSKGHGVEELNKLRQTARAFRNRLAAKKSRITKRMSVKDMERRLQTLEQENDWLRQQLSSSDISSTSTTVLSYGDRSVESSSVISVSSHALSSDDEMNLCDLPERPSPCPTAGSA
jgi:hypothetical protein